MVKKGDKEKLYDNLSLELRRGVLVLAVLSQLRQEQYGYSLKHILSQQGLDIGEGTLYPLLRRLEKQALLESSWQVVNDTRPRRYYRVSPAGEMMLGNLTMEWNSLAGIMDGLLGAVGSVGHET